MRLKIPALILAACLAASALSADIPNGAFSDGLDQWTATGSVVPQDGVALLRDQSAYSSLWIPYLFTGPGVFSFDFQGLFSDTVPQGAGPDVFFVTLYFVNDLADFDLAANQYDAVLPLLDADRSGNTALTGTVENATAPGWFTFTALLETAFRYAIPVFEFFNDNLLANDSEVRVDNVSLLNTVPRISGLTVTGLVLQVDFEHFSEAAVTHQVLSREDLDGETDWLPLPATITPTGHATFQAELALPANYPTFLRVIAIEP